MKGDLDGLRFDVAAQRPDNLAFTALATQLQRRGDIVADLDAFPNRNPPVKLAEYITDPGLGSLEMPIAVFLIACLGLGTQTADLRQITEGVHLTPVAVVFDQPAKALLAMKQQVFAPFVIDALDADAAPQVTDGLIVDPVQGAMRAQRNQRLIGEAGLERGEDAEVVIAQVDDRAAAPAGQALTASRRTNGQAAGTVWALKRTCVQAGIRFPADRRHRAQLLQSQLIKAHRLAHEDQRRRFAVIQGGEGLTAGLQIDQRRVIARANANRQLALAADTAGVLDIGDLEHPALERHRVSGAQPGQGWQRLGRCDVEGQRVLAEGFAQPATTLVVEQQVPLIPQTLAVAQLDAPDHGKAALAVNARGAKLDRRRIRQQLGHPADVFQIQIVADQGAPAIGAHGQDRRGGLEIDCSATGGAVGSFHGRSDTHSGPRRPNGLCRLSRSAGVIIFSL